MNNSPLPGARLVRVLLAPLVLALLLAGLSGPGASAETGSASTDPSSAPDPASGPRPAERSLSGDMVHPEARTGVLARGRLWSGRAIRYHEKIPGKWDWSLDRALDHWNESGARIRFKEVGSARRADLHISYGNTGGSDGRATVGHQAYNWVHLSKRYKRQDATDATTRVWVGRLFAHELGHVLGFDHTRGCTLMTPVFMMGPGGCPLLANGDPGYYYCRWIDKALLGRFIDWYGGRAQRPGELCLIEALPPALDDVEFSGGGSAAPVAVTWRPPTRVRTGTKVVVSTWRKPECAATPPRAAIVEKIDPAKGAWVEDEYGQGEQCYLVQIVNRYGAGRPGVLERREQHAPVPSAPEIGAPTWRGDRGAWAFTWQPHYGYELVAHHAPSGQCHLTYDDSLRHYPTGGEEDGTWVIQPREAEECVSFFVVTYWGTVSPATTLELKVPAPPAPEVTLSWDAGAQGWQAAWAPADPTWVLVVMRGPSGACPTVYDPAEAQWLWEDDPGMWSVWAGEVEECLSFFVEDSFGQVSPVTQKDVTVPAPTATPVVGEPSPGEAGSGVATVTATVPDGASGIRVEVVPGACPQAVPADAEWWDGDQDWDDETLWRLYPEPWDATGPSCAHFAVFDTWDRHGPVVSRTFTAG